ncbi:MAG: hypothetical protein ABJH05_12965 [Fulvivirga sp.]
MEKEDKKQTTETEDETIEETFEDEEEGFGGLPDRDLKKNLGCS